MGLALTSATTTRFPDAACPFCGIYLGAATHCSEVARPVPGDFCICISCAQVLVFDAELVPRAPAAGQLEAAFAEEPGFEQAVRQHQAAARKVVGFSRGH